MFTIALTAQINVDPSRRSYDPETRTRLVELFGEPERWAATTHSFLWAHDERTRPELHRLPPDGPLPVACTYDLELAALNYFRQPLLYGYVPLSFHFSGSVLHRGDDGRYPGGRDPVVVHVALADAHRDLAADDAAP